MLKTSFIGLRVSPELKESLEKEAKLLNISISNLIIQKLNVEQVPQSLRDFNQMIDNLKNVKQKQPSKTVKHSPILEPIVKHVKPQDVKHPAVSPEVTIIGTAPVKFDVTVPDKVIDAKKYDFDAMRKATEQKRKTKQPPPTSFGNNRVT